MSCEEREPLLKDRDIEATISSAPPTLDRFRLLQTSPYFNVNLPWLMVSEELMGTLKNVSVVAGSHFFVLATHDAFTPRCSTYGDVPGAVCGVCFYCFWTFPIVCIAMTLLIFVKTFFEKRLYYECLLHRILLCYNSEAIYSSYFVLVFFVWGGVGTCSLFFLTPHTTDLGHYWVLIFGMLAYYVPLVSFMLILSERWDVSSGLIPFAKIYNVDPGYAMQFCRDSIVVPVHHLQVAFEIVDEALSDQSLTSSEYFGLLAETARCEVSRAMELATPPAADPGFLTRLLGLAGAPMEERALTPRADRGFFTRLLRLLGLPRMEEFSTKMHHVSRPELISFSWQARRGYWVFRLFFSRNLTDERARVFKRWSVIYMIVLACIMILVVHTFLSTSLSFLKHQKYIEEIGVFKNKFGVMQPVALPGLTGELLRNWTSR